VAGYFALDGPAACRLRLAHTSRQGCPAAWPRPCGRRELRARPCALASVGESFNTLFRVRPGDGSDYLLRVGPTLRLHPQGSEEVEAAWLTSLGQDTAIEVAHVFRNSSQELVTRASSPGVPEPRTCSLLRWIPGRALGDRVDPGTAASSGRILAALHDHADGWEPPTGGAVPIADRVLYWDDAPSFGLLGSRYRTLFLEAAERAQAAIDSLWAARPHRPHLLHGDLTPRNIVQTRRGLAPIDFQDLIVGFDVQDIAISLLPFQRHAATESLSRAFREGYETVRGWPETTDENLDALFAARRLLMANLALNLRKPGLDAYLAFAAARLADWMQP